MVGPVLLVSFLMPERDFAALESYGLVPRLLHDVQQADTGALVLGRACPAPILPLVEALYALGPAAESFCLVPAELLQAALETVDYSRSIPLIKSRKMGELMPRVRDFAAKGVPALALDMTVLAHTPPFGHEPWRPRSKEDLAELRAAAGVPFWLYGVASPADAEAAMEAGLEAVVVHAGAGLHLSSPATIDMFPEIFDAVAGMTLVYAGGPVRGGIDIFRYLAVGAEAVIVESDRPVPHLQAELEYAMRLTGCQTLADIGYETIFAPLFGEV